MTDDEKKCIKFLEELQDLCEEYGAQIYNRNTPSEELARLVSTLHIRVGSKTVVMPKLENVNSKNLCNVIAHLKYIAD